jgi:hypothetical protein
MPANTCEEDAESLRLPRNWHSLVRSVVLNFVGIIRIAMLAGREPPRLQQTPNTAVNKQPSRS